MGKQVTIKTAKNKLTYWFNRYIRLRDFKKGCISCGKRKNWGKTWQAGHYHTNGSTWASLTFHEKNVNGQCAQCNLEEGNKGEYAIGLIERYGKEIFELFRIIRATNKGNVWSVFHYQILAKEYEEKCRPYEEENGIEHGKTASVKRTNWKKQYQSKKQWKPKVIDMA